LRDFRLTTLQAEKLFEIRDAAEPHSSANYTITIMKAAIKAMTTAKADTICHM
jgi:hypothetical protein